MCVHTAAAQVLAGFSGALLEPDLYEWSSAATSASSSAFRAFFRPDEGLLLNPAHTSLLAVEGVLCRAAAAAAAAASAAPEAARSPAPAPTSNSTAPGQCVRLRNYVLEF